MALNKSTAVEKVARKSAQAKHNAFLAGYVKPEGFNLDEAAELLAEIYEGHKPWFLEKLTKREEVLYNKLLKG